MESIPRKTVDVQPVDVKKLLVLMGWSGTEAMRLIKAGAVSINGDKVNRLAFIADSDILRVGKRFIRRLRSADI